MTVISSTIPLFDQAYMRDPYPVLSTLRNQAPVHVVQTPTGLRVWLVVRYDDVRALLNDSRLRKDMAFGRQFLTHNFVSDAMREEALRQTGTGLQIAAELTEHMLDKDPPDHTRLRKLVGRAFTSQRVEALRPRIEELVDQLLDDAGRSGTRIDLLEALALPVPFTVICWLLGVPQEDRTDFRRWSNILISGAGGENLPETNRSMIDYLRGLIAAKRAAGGDDMLTALIQSHDDEARLTEDELVSMAFLLLIAGHETTVNLIGNGTLALLTHPEQRALVTADPTLWPNAIEEFLRFDAPVNSSTLRFTATEVQVGDVTIPAGEIVILSLGAANRDPDQYPDPDALDVTRSQSSSVAFGHGIHYCVGAPLARLEGQVVLSRLFARYPDLRLAVPVDELRWRFALVMRGLEELPVHLS